MTSISSLVLRESKVDWNPDQIMIKIYLVDVNFMEKKIILRSNLCIFFHISMLSKKKKKSLTKENVMVT